MLFTEVGIPATLCIGEAQLGNIVFDHSWLEVESQIYDAAIMRTLERNFNLTYPVADWFFGTSDLKCGLLKHVFNGYDSRCVRSELTRRAGG